MITPQELSATINDKPITLPLNQDLQTYTVNQSPRIENLGLTQEDRGTYQLNMNIDGIGPVKAGAIVVLDNKTSCENNPTKEYRNGYCEIRN